jgi:hypothetical protein
MRRVVTAVLLAVALSVPLRAADNDPSAPVQPVIAGEVTSNVNIRSGPHLQAKPYALLKAGDQVQVIGPASGAPDWLVVRFPEKGKAWVHRKNLTALPDGRYKVIGRGANVRDDATLGANRIAELAVGEVLVGKGQVVGDWIAVYPANAVAYVKKDYVQLAGTVDLGAIAQAQKQQREDADRLWALVQSTYADFRTAAQARPETALSKDWTGLKAQLATVVATHPDVQVRVAAEAIAGKVSELIEAAKRFGAATGTPVQPVAQVPTTTATTTTATTAPPANGTGTTPAQAPVAPAELIKTLPVAAPVSPYAAEGLVILQEFPKLGVTYVIMDQDQRVVGFLKSKDGSIQLSEYNFRYVGVKGSTETAPREAHGLDRDPPVITVSEVVLLNR